MKSPRTAESVSSSVNSSPRKQQNHRTLEPGSPTKKPASKGRRKSKINNLMSNSSNKSMQSSIDRKKKRFEKQIVEEEQKFGVDHYDDDILDTGNSHCLKAYLDFRA